MKKKTTPRKKATPSVSRRLFNGENFELAEARAFPAFPTSRLQISTSNLVLRDIGYMDEAQRSRLVAFGSPSAGSSVTFDVIDWCTLHEPFEEDTRLHVYQGPEPGIYGERIVDSQGVGSWRLYVVMSPQYFDSLQRHISGVDAFTGEKVRSRPMSDVVEFGGTFFTPLDPDNPASLNFKAELRYVKLGGRILLEEK